MFASETRETIYTAIGLFIAAIVLGLLSYVIGLRSDIATVFNDESVTRQTLEAYNTYNKYQNTTLYGEDVISAIREFANTDIAVYVDKLYLQNGTYHEKFYSDESNSDKYTLEALEYGGNGSDLASGVKRNATYRAYLVFGLYDKDAIMNYDFSDSSKNTNYADVTGIHIEVVSPNDRI